MNRILCCHIDCAEKQSVCSRVSCIMTQFDLMIRLAIGHAVKLNSIAAAIRLPPPPHFGHF